ncbi:MAG: Zn-dependent hydrolase [Gammaproteobacteria bacterium]|nr:Zn-dependent hydrolase [Gammaproteobacteria bacterium]
MKTKFIVSAILLAGLLAGCEKDQQADMSQSVEQMPMEPMVEAPAAAEEPSRFDIYADVGLTADLSHLTDNQREMIGLLIEAGKITDDIFWQQVWGDKDELLNSIDDPKAKQFAFYNYGPWDRLAGDQPFIESYGPRPPGARFYPEDMTRSEFEEWQQEGKDGLYSLVQRDASGGLTLVPYSEAFESQINEIARLLVRAAVLAEDKEFAAYLILRAEALKTDDYQLSDMAWMDMKDNPIELVIGPIETYQDALFGYRAAFETFVLIKDQVWSERLARFAKYMPQLQQGLPVDDAYKAEMPGSDADLNAYDLAYCAGDCNSGAKTIAINLPNDEEVQLAKGTRRLQLKNSMLAKFNQILMPIANALIAEDQRQYITFDAFFSNTMFHEVAHGLGIKNTLDGAGTVRQALKEHSSALEEGKADILGLYMVQKLREMGEITEGELMDNYVTFLAGIFRSVRFGASSAHGRANMIRFNYFSDAGAFTRDPETGTYRVNVEAFELAIKNLGNDILVLQGNGDYDAVADFVAEMGNVSDQLQADLNRLDSLSIPVDIVYQQGKAELGL